LLSLCVSEPETELEAECELETEKDGSSAKPLGEIRRYACYSLDEPLHSAVVERRRQLIFVGVAADRANLGAEDAIGKELSRLEPPEFARWTESGRCRERLNDVMPTSRTVCA